MNRIVAFLLTATVFIVTACESTPKRYEPEPEPEPREQPEPQPEPEPAPVIPQLVKATPPDRPWKAIERESIDPQDYPRPTFSDLMDGPVAKWRDALSPAFVPGKPHAMQNVQTSGSWFDGKATLKVESITLSNGGWSAQGYGQATWNSNGALFAKAYFREGKLHGPAIFYDEQGNIESIRCYNMGAAHGPWATFSNGTVKSRGEYRDGYAGGIWLSWDDNGVLNRRSSYKSVGAKSQREWERTYNDKGQLDKYTGFKDGQPFGDRISWVEPKLDDDGKVTNADSVGRLEVVYYDENGDSHGWQTIYSPSGKYRVYDTWYEHGKQTGPFIKYDKDGNKLLQGHKKDGVDTGRWKEWASGGYTYEYGYGPDGPDAGRQGEYVTRDPDGNVTSKGQYKDGKRVGKWSYVSAFGDRTEYNYSEDGLYDGDYLVTDKDGKVRTSGRYKDGKAVGHWTMTTLGLYEVIDWKSAADLDVVVEGDFVDGKRDGEWKVTFEGALIAAGAYKNGLRDGTWQYYHVGGGLGANADYKGGLLDGQWEEFNDQGAVTFRSQYKNGKRAGEYTAYYPDGTIQTHGNFAVVLGVSLHVGDWDTFNEAGELIERSAYDGNGDYKGKLTREAPLEEVPEGVVIDPEKPNGIWLTYPVGSDVYTQRMRVINGEGAGLFEQYYSDGTLGVKGQVTGGAREGAWSYYYADGKLKETANFSANALNGEYNRYRTDGTLAESGSYTAGKKSGSWKIFANDGEQAVSEINYNADGVYDGPWRTWNDQGQMLSETNYAAGKKHGVAKTWSEEGKQMSECSYADGNLDGPYKTWFEDGTVRTEAAFKAGKRTGTYKSWNKSGQVVEERNYDDQGRPHGTHKTWFDNGKQSSQAEYKEGKPTGTWTEWNEDGTIKSETNHNEQPGDEEPGSEK